MYQLVIVSPIVSYDLEQHLALSATLHVKFFLHGYHLFLHVHQ